MFRGVLFGRSIGSFARGKTAPVVLDIMSPSDTIRDLFKDVKDGNKLGIAVSLSDRRSKFRKQADRKLGIEQIAGDLMKSSTWNEIDKKLNGRKVDLIMERGELGLRYVPDSPKFLAIIVSKLWNLLSFENGTALLQLGNCDVIKSWLNLLSERNIDAYFNVGISGSVLRIDKTLTSPAKLPFLP